MVLAAPPRWLREDLRMIDESMDKEQMAQPAQPWEFRSKPAWQPAGDGRRCTLQPAAAFHLYAMVLFTWNDTYLPLKNVTQGMEFSQAAKNAGFQDGDILLRADDTELERFGVRTLLDVTDASTVTVLRNGQEVALSIPKTLMQNLLADKEGFANYRVPAVVNETMEGSAAREAGLVRGDSIVGINGTATPLFADLRTILDNNRNGEVSLDYYRSGTLHTTAIRVDSAGTLGFYAMGPAQVYRTVTRTYGFFESFPAGTRRVFRH